MTEPGPQAGAGATQAGEGRPAGIGAGSTGVGAAAARGPRPPPVCDVAVVGAGWAGLAAAVELVRAGRRVAVLDAAMQPGGRARALTLRLAGAEVELDNGQHLLIGAYRECERLARLVSPGGEAPLQRHRLLLQSIDGLRLRAARLPAPLHLLAAMLAARGLTLAERAAMLRMMAALRLSGWRARPGETVQAMLERLRQPASLQRRLWAPLALGALNTGVEQACAQTFATVLRDSLGADARAADFLLPAGTLSDVLPRPAWQWLQARGADLRLRCPVRALVRDPAGGWRLRIDREGRGPQGGPDGRDARNTQGEPGGQAGQDTRIDPDDRQAREARSEAGLHARQVVLAVPPAVAAGLLAPAARSEAERRAVEALAGFRYESIATVYLAWPASAVPALPGWIMLEEEPQAQAFGQWLFDRGVQQGRRIAAVVVSARGRAAGIEAPALARGIALQVSRQLRLPPPADWRAVTDKRATFLCLPDRPRPDPGAFGDLRLAGDHAWPDYPATLEGAVRSGVAAARALAAPAA